MRRYKRNRRRANVITRASVMTRANKSRHKPINLMMYAVTWINFGHDEYFDMRSHVSRGWAYCIEMTFSSREASRERRALLRGHLSAAARSHRGPCHHCSWSLISPNSLREAQSAVLSSIDTCRHSAFGRRDWISLTRLATNVFHRERCLPTIEHDRGIRPAITRNVLVTARSANQLNKSGEQDCRR